MASSQLSADLQPAFPNHSSALEAFFTSVQPAELFSHHSSFSYSTNSFEQPCSSLKPAVSCGIPVGSVVHVVKRGSKGLASAEHFVGLAAGMLAGFLSGC